MHASNYGSLQNAIYYDNEQQLLCSTTLDEHLAQVSDILSKSVCSNLINIQAKSIITKQWQYSQPG